MLSHVIRLLCLSGKKGVRQDRRELLISSGMSHVSQSARPSLFLLSCFPSLPPPSFPLGAVGERRRRKRETKIGGEGDFITDIFFGPGDGEENKSLEGQWQRKGPLPHLPLLFVSADRRAEPSDMFSLFSPFCLFSISSSFLPRPWSLFHFLFFSRVDPSPLWYGFHRRVSQ